MSDQRRAPPRAPRFVTPLFTADQGKEDDVTSFRTLNRTSRHLPQNSQQDQLKKEVTNPMEIIGRSFEKTELPKTLQYQASSKLKKTIGQKPPPAYVTPKAVHAFSQAPARAPAHALGRSCGVLEPISQHHIDCFDGNKRASNSAGINAKWIDRKKTFGNMETNTQLKYLEMKTEEVLQSFTPKKWAADMDAKERVLELQETMKAQPGGQLPYIPLERATMASLSAPAEIWRDVDVKTSQSSNAFNQVMSMLHRQDIITQMMMEETPSLDGPGNRIKAKCKNRAYCSKESWDYMEREKPEWHKDVLGKWSILHGFAIPHLQTLPEILSKYNQKFMVEDGAPNPPVNSPLPPDREKIEEGMEDGMEDGIAENPEKNEEETKDGIVENTEKTEEETKEEKTEEETKDRIIENTEKTEEDGIAQNTETTEKVTEDGIPENTETTEEATEDGIAMNTEKTEEGTENGIVENAEKTEEATEDGITENTERMTEEEIQEIIVEIEVEEVEDNLNEEAMENRIAENREKTEEAMEDGIAGNTKRTTEEEIQEITVEIEVEEGDDNLNLNASELTFMEPSELNFFEAYELEKHRSNFLDLSALEMKENWNKSSTSTRTPSMDTINFDPRRIRACDAYTNLSLLRGPPGETSPGTNEMVQRIHHSGKRITVPEVEDPKEKPRKCTK